MTETGNNEWSSLLLSGSIGESLSLKSIIIIMGSALILGIGISLVYILTHREEVYAVGFTVSLIMLPVIISMIILLVGNNVARAFSLAGAFSLIRFRSAPGDPKDIAYVFFTLGVGLSCGMGYIVYAAIFAAVLCVVMIVLGRVKFGERRRMPMQLRIYMPEDMDYHGVFDDILREHTSRSRLLRVKTAEFGALFELTYLVVLNDIGESKHFIDKLRCKNGNLNIVLSMAEAKEA